MVDNDLIGKYTISLSALDSDFQACHYWPLICFVLVMEIIIFYFSCEHDVSIAYRKLHDGCQAGKDQSSGAPFMVYQCVGFLLLVN